MLSAANYKMQYNMDHMDSESTSPEFNRIVSYFFLKLEINIGHKALQQIENKKGYVYKWVLNGFDLSSFRWIIQLFSWFAWFQGDANTNFRQVN